MTVTAMKQWIRAAVMVAIALGSSGALPVGESAVECLDPPPPHPVPPPEAFEACQAHAQEAACEVVLPDQVVAGLCVTAPDGELFCRPFTPPPPPPEAFTACEGLAADEACGIQLECGVVRGTCDSTPAGWLYCRPPFAPHF